METTGEEERNGSTQEGSQGDKVHYIKEENGSETCYFITLYNTDNMKIKFKSSVTENDYVYSRVLDNYKLG